MKTNYCTVLEASKVLLVPYRREHVERYHDFMKDPYLLEMTGSEPLTFEEEIEMQQTWRDDDDKCTFILLRNDKLEETLIDSFGQAFPDDLRNQEGIPKLSSSFIGKNIPAMIGDANLFFHKHEEDEDVKCAELDIMIADNLSRRKGFGRQAVAALMIYAYHKLKVRRFYVKIKSNNNASRKLFESMDFVERSFIECFQEYELDYLVDNESLLKLDAYTDRQLAVYYLED